MKLWSLLGYCSLTALPGALSEWHGPAALNRGNSKPFSGGIGGKMTYAELFYEIKGKFMGADVSDIHEHLAFQFNIEDKDAGGAFYVEVKEGKLYVEPYEYYDRDAMFICAPEVLLEIADGRLDPVAAFTEQKLRVEGNIEKALRLKEIIEMKREAVQGEKGVVQKAADKVVNTIVKTAVKKSEAKSRKQSKKSE